MNKGISVKLIKIDLLERILKVPEYPEALESFDFQHNIQIEVKVNVEQDRLLSLLSVDTRRIGEDAILGRIKLALTFRFENISAYFSDSDKDHPQAAAMIKEINKITISTARGVLFSEYRGTALQAAVLPLLEIGEQAAEA